MTTEIKELVENEVKRSVKSAKKVGADAGNNGTKLEFQGQPSIYIPSNISYYIGSNLSEDLNDQPFDIEKLHEQLDITVSSPALQMKTRYIVGEKCITDQLEIIEMEENSEKDKSEIPIITTLAGLGVDIIRSNASKIKEDKGEFFLKGSYDLACGLPIKNITVSKAKELESKYMGTHTLIFHIREDLVIKVEIVIEFCKCLPEGAAAAWGIVYDEKGKLIKHQITVANNQIVEVTLENRLLLHFDIGGGTVEEVVTQGVVLQTKLSDGLPYGTKKTIQDAISVWNKHNPRKSIDSMLEFNKIYFNSEHPRHNAVVQFFASPLRGLSVRLSTEFVNRIDRLKDDPIIFIYGGGSALLKEFLLPVLEAKNIENIIFTKNPMYENAKGLLVYALSTRYQQLKEKTLEVV